jgi:hypothetical protein
MATAHDIALRSHRFFIITAAGEFLSRSIHVLPFCVVIGLDYVPSVIGMYPAVEFLIVHAIYPALGNETTIPVIFITDFCFILGIDPMYFCQVTGFVIGILLAIAETAVKVVALHELHLAGRIEKDVVTELESVGLYGNLAGLAVQAVLFKVVGDRIAGAHKQGGCD